MKGTLRWEKAASQFNAGKKTSAAIFDKATRVETFRLFPTSASDKPVGDVRGFATYWRGTTGAGFARKLGAVLLRPDTYVLPGQSTTLCYFEPGVAYRVWSGTKFLDVVVCFHCNQLGVVENDPKVPERNIGGRLSARMNVLGNFNPARAELLSLTKEAFASDEALQAIR